MRLYAFRTSGDIPVDEAAGVCRTVGAIMGITPELVEQPLGDIEPGRLLEVSTSFLDRGQAMVAVIFTNGAHDEVVLGEGMQQSRGAWVGFCGDRNRTVLTTLHELGHICEGRHCTRSSCLMYPYYVERQVEGATLAALLCASCHRVITESWVYRRMLAEGKAEERKAGQPGPGTVVQGAALELESGKSGPVRSFPDWSLPREVFIKQVKQFFGYE
jgi:hypothetical protein